MQLPNLDDVVGRAEMVSDGVTSPLELVNEAIDRIEARNPELNAVIHPLFEPGLRRAASPTIVNTRVRGVPMLVKDMLCEIAGAPYHMGMKLLRDLEWRGRRDSYLSVALAEAGFIVLGRTNTPELAISLDTDCEAYGPTLNPWDRTLSAGGSSGGSAAAVASGMVPIAHGNDISGSIRVPASACGVIGLKPTRGRVSLGPRFGQHWAMLTQDGCFTRSVRDAALFLDSVSRPIAGDPYAAPDLSMSWSATLDVTVPRLRIGLQTKRLLNKGAVHPECVRAAEQTASAFENLGHQVDSVDVGDMVSDSLQFAFHDIVAAWVNRELTRLGTELGRVIGAADIEGRTWKIAQRGMQMPASEYLAAVEQLEQTSRLISQHWASRLDVLVTPTLPDLPLRRELLDADRNLVDREGVGCFTLFANVTGQPAISLPVYWTADGIPVGVQLVAGYGREDILFQVARQLESAGFLELRDPCAERTGSVRLG